MANSQNNTNNKVWLHKHTTLHLTDWDVCKIEILSGLKLYDKWICSDTVRICCGICNVVVLGLKKIIRYVHRPDNFPSWLLNPCRVGYWWYRSPLEKQCHSLARMKGITSSSRVSSLHPVFLMSLFSFLSCIQQISRVIWVPGFHHIMKPLGKPLTS